MQDSAAELADVNGYCDGYTALHVAVREHRLEIVEVCPFSETQNLEVVVEPSLSLL